MLTKALVVAAAGEPFTLQDVIVRDEELHEDEVLVEMSATGVCHTDLNFRHEDKLEGLFPGVLGHEGAGKVLKVGSAVTNAAPGDHVLITYTHCGKCRKCLAKQTSYCKTWEAANFGVYRRAYSFLPEKNGDVEVKGAEIRSHFFGQSSMSKHAIVMANCLVKVDKDAPLHQLAPLGCGIMTGAGAMLNVIRPAPQSTVVVVGVGAVGLAAIMAVKINPLNLSKIIAVDIVPERLELAKKYGATDVINGKETPDLAKALRDLTDDEGVDGAIDTTGRPQVLEALIEGCAKRGTVVSVGVGDVRIPLLSFISYFIFSPYPLHRPFSVNANNQHHYPHYQITAKTSLRIWHHVNSGRSYAGCAMGSCYPPEFIPQLIAAWKKGDFPFTDVQKQYPVAEIAQAEKDALSGDVIKPVLIWD